MLQREGDISSDVYYVVHGLLRSYALDDKGKEHTFMFGPEGWIVGDTNAVSEPCDLYIDVLEDSTIKVIDKTSAIAKSNEHMALFKRINVLQKRVLMMMTHTAIQKYKHFQKVYPSLTLRVPQKMIATYLGLTPETFSKVKRQVLYSS